MRIFSGGQFTFKQFGRNKRRNFRTNGCPAWNDGDIRVFRERLVKLVQPLGKAFGLDSERIGDLKIAVRLHDIGQIALPYALLSKKGKLKEGEYALVKEHPVIGARILQKYQVNSRVTRAVKHHHEWFDGTGYPSGLTGADIPLESRIISVLEAYDAMIQARGYKEKLTPEKAMEELWCFAGVQFDKNVVSVLNKLVSEYYQVEETRQSSKTI